MRKKGVKNPDVFFDCWRSCIPKNNSFGENVKEKELDCDNIDGRDDAFSIFIFSLGVMLCIDCTQSIHSSPDGTVSGELAQQVESSVYLTKIRLPHPSMGNL